MMESPWFVAVCVGESTPRVQKYTARVMLMIKTRIPENVPIAYAYPLIPEEPLYSVELSMFLELFSCV